MRKPWHALAAPAAKAYHEAGHVVVAYAFGGQVRRGGVRSGVWAHVWHPNFVTANVCVLMAGYLAEEKFQGHHWRCRAMEAGNELARANSEVVGRANHEATPSRC